MLETTGARRFTQGPYPEQRLNACELYCFFMTFTIAYLKLCQAITIIYVGVIKIFQELDYARNCCFTVRSNACADCLVRSHARLYSSSRGRDL